MKSNLISKTESSKILGDISVKWGMDLPKTKNLRVHDIADDAQLIVGDGFKALKIDNLGEYVPFLSETSILEAFPSVTVDMGAVKFMCKGANVMRPGIKDFTEFHKDAIVCVVEESRHKFLAVGISTVDSSKVETMERGEVLKNVHFVSDRFWEAGKSIAD